MNFIRKLWILLFLFAAIIMSCPNDTGTEFNVQPVTLTAGNPVDVNAGVTEATVTFNGAEGVILTTGDFIVSGDATIKEVFVIGDKVQITVTFPENESNSEIKTYTVSISSASKKIKGDASVTITQTYVGDTRQVLTPLENVIVAGNETIAYAKFSGAVGLELILEKEDFTVSSGAVISSANVDSAGYANVVISFSANTSTGVKTYTIGINQSGERIRGTGTVTVTQQGRVILKAYYVSAAGDDNNQGSESFPWKSVARANLGPNGQGGNYQPGDAILFRCGDVWTATGGDTFLGPNGSGAPGNPILIGSYSSGNKPHLEGKGLVNNVIRLHNQQYWEISDIEISNMVEGWTNPAARNDVQGTLIANKDLRGIYLTGDNGETLNNFNMHDLYIHDVTGEIRWIGGAAFIGNPNPIQNYPGIYSQAGWDASKRTGAIIVDALRASSGAGSTTATVFNDVTVENNVMLRNSFSAFTTKQAHGGESGVQWAFPEITSYPYNHVNFKPHTNITVRGNYIDQEGFYHGDGIYLTSVRGALVEKNVVANPGVCGIELYWSDNITVQYNEVYGSVAKAGGNDTNGIDPDVRTSNIIVQYNYVHDNGDGIMMCGGQYNTVIVRYNILWNNTGIWIRDMCDNGYVQVLNNVLYNTKAQAATVGRINFVGTTTNNSSGDRWEFKNNVFYNAHAQTTSFNFDTRNNYFYDSNIYIGATGPTGTNGDPNGINATADMPIFTGSLASFGTGNPANKIRFSNFDFLKPAPGSLLINKGVEYTAVNPPRIDKAPNGLDYAGLPVGKADLGIFASNFKGLAGTVTNSWNEPVADAIVKLNSALQATTNASGRYLFPAVPNGEYQVNVIHADYADGTNVPWTGNPLIVDKDKVSWLLLKTGALSNITLRNVAGTVTNAETGIPVEGAVVTIAKQDIDTKTATTDTQGRYTLLGVQSGGGYTVTVTKADHYTTTISSFMVPSSGDVARTNLTIRPYAHATAINISYSNISLRVGQSSEVFAVFTPTDTYNKNVTWNSGNTGIATVTPRGSSGTSQLSATVTGVAVGTTSVTITSQDGGLIGTAAVTVKAALTPGGNGFFANFENVQMTQDSSGTTSGHPFVQGGTFPTTWWSAVNGVSGNSSAGGTQTVMMENFRPETVSLGGTNKVARHISNGSGARGVTLQFGNSYCVNGDVVHIEFDWYPGRPSARWGAISVLDRAAPPFGTTPSNRYITFFVQRIADDSDDPINVSRARLSYQLGNFTENTDNTAPVASTPILVDLSQTMNSMFRWFHVKIAIDLQNQRISFAISDPAESTVMHSETDLPFAAGITYSNLGVCGLRFYNARNDDGWTTYFDNFYIGTNPFPND